MQLYLFILSSARVSPKIIVSFPWESLATAVIVRLNVTSFCLIRIHRAGRRWILRDEWTIRNPGRSFLSVRRSTDSTCSTGQHSTKKTWRIIYAQYFPKKEKKKCLNTKKCLTRTKPDLNNEAQRAFFFLHSWLSFIAFIFADVKRETYAGFWFPLGKK